MHNIVYLRTAAENISHLLDPSTLSTMFQNRLQRMLKTMMVENLNHYQMLYTEKNIRRCNGHLLALVYIPLGLHTKIILQNTAVKPWANENGAVSLAKRMH